MADKEATVYIVDVSRSMRKSRQGRNECDLDWAMKYVWDKIANTVASGRKQWTVGVVGLGTDGTENELGAEEGFEHISVLHPISQILMPDLRHLQTVIKPSSTNDRDAVSSLIIAVQLIIKYCKQLKYQRRIVLVTNGNGSMDTDPDTVNEIIKKLTKDNIELVVLGVDFDDADYGFKEEDKTSLKRQNETFLRDIVEKCGGTFGTMLEAVEEMNIPRVKSTRPVNSYKGQLRLGDPEKYATALCIDVERYPRTMIRRPESASSYVLKSEAGSQSQVSQSNGDELTNVRNEYAYQVKDPAAADGKRDVGRDDLARGYEYGRTVVHINESDENITKLETEAAMEIIGFVAASEFERYIALETSNVIVAQKTNDKAILALSSLIHALFELDSCAIARVVKKDMQEPLLKILSPDVKPDYECLVENELPFAEDVRPYRFPPLDKIVTVSGKILQKHRNLPSDDLVNAMSDFVDQMDLSTFERDDNGEPSEYMALDDAFSPVLHRLEQAKRWRAINPNDPIPPVPDVLIKYSNPPDGLLRESRSSLARVLKAADVKKVPAKAKGRKRNREMDKPLSGLNVDDLFRKEKRTKIDPANAIPEFKQALAVTEDLDAVKDAVAQMTAIVEEQIRISFGDANYARAVEGLGVMRQELLEFQEPALYNDALKGLRRKIMGEELGGNRKEMWWFVRRTRVGLITKGLPPGEEVTEEEAKEFLKGS